MVRKTMALLLTLCMLLASVPVTAQEKACARLSSQAANAGETIELELDLSGCDGFLNLGLEISYDDSVLTLMSVSENKGVGAIFTTAQTLDANPYNIGWNSITNVSYHGNLATFTFQISDDAKAGEYIIELGHYKGRNGNYTDGYDVNYDENENPLGLTYYSGCVTVKPEDVPQVPDNGEGEITTGDVTASLSAADGYRGETVDVTLALSGNTGFLNLGLEISYDDSALTLISVSENEGIGATFTPAQNLDANPYNIGWNSIINVGYNGNLATFTFQISDDAKAGEYIIELGHYKGRNGNYTDGYDVNYDENDKPLGLNYENGCINVLNTPITQPEPTVENTYNGNVYMVIEDKVSWLEAKALCEEAGGHLATITSAKENDFVRALCSGLNGSQYYLGAANLYSQGMWNWINGEKFVYTNWSADKVDAGDGDGAYLVMHSETGKWSGESASDRSGIGFVCEWEGDSSEKESVYWVEFVSQKEIYAIGEEFDVQVWLYTDESALRIYDGYTVSGFDSSKPGWYTVIVSYGDYSGTFEVEVVDDGEALPVATYVVQSLATEGVTISPSGYSMANEGTTMKFVVGVKEGYNIDTVTINGEAVKLSDSNLSVIITKDTVIEVTGKKKTYLIESDVSGNGAVELSSETIEYGGSCTARIIADDGYIISDVRVDGNSVGVCKYYTFTNVRENHSITATFEKVIETFTVKATAGEGGKITPARSVVNSGNSAVFTVTADYGYHVKHAVVDDEIKNISSDKIVVEHITRDTNVSVVFEKDVFQVSANSSEGAQIYVVYNEETANRLSVPYMETADIVVEVEDGYKLNTLYVNNAPVKPEKCENKLVYRFLVTKNTVVSARCIPARTSVFNQQVAQAGLAADINADNAYQKKAEFISLSEQYTMLSDDEKVVCTSAYATVLSALDRANAYIALTESDIIAEITALPELDELGADNFRNWKGSIDSIYIKYENLTYLSKSLIDYKYTSKLSQLKSKAEMFDRESKNIISYLYECIEAVPYGENINTDHLFDAYSKLMLAEDTYYNLSEENKKQVSDDMYHQLFDKHGRISTQIHKLYVTPFTSKVLRCSGVNPTDSIEVAEAKRVQIYDLMNEYHSFPAFVEEQVSASTVQKLNSLYENASIKVSTTVNDMPVDMNGDFDEDVDLVLTEPELDSDEITAATGKTVYQAIDVKMYSDEQEIQPASKIRIKMEIGEELRSADVSVIYIDNDGVVYDVQGEVIEEDSKYYIVFFVDHFSSFAVLYNETTAPKPVIRFDTEFAQIGDKITATVSGAINTADCNLFMAGYTQSGVVTFVEIGDKSVSATIAENTVTVKVMLWDKNMAPIINPEILTVDGVVNDEPAPSDPVIRFDTEFAKIGDDITATVSGAINTADCNLFMAGYTQSEVVTFVEMGDKSVSATIAENTVTVKVMLWDKNMTPIIDPKIMSTAQ